MSITDKINENLAKGEVVEYCEVTAKLAELQDQYGSVIPDCSTKEGFEFSKLAASVCREIRLNLESIRKEKKAPYLNYGKLIDSQAKDIKAKLEAIELPHKQAYQAKDAERKAILEKRKQTIADLNQIYSQFQYADKLAIELKISEVEDMEIDKDTFGRLVPDAIDSQAAAIKQLYRAHAEAVEREIEAEKAAAEKAELEQLRKDAEKRKAEQERIEAQQKEAEEKAEQERLQKEAAERAKAEAEERAKADIEAAERAAEEAEQARINAEKQAEINAKNAEIKAKEDAERAAEIARQSEIKRQQDEEAKAKADEEARKAKQHHRAKIHKQAKDGLVAAGLSNEDAIKAVKAISSNSVLNVSIKY